MRALKLFPLFLLLAICSYGQGIYNQATASGTDTYTATVTPTFTAYYEGQKFTIEFTNANTGAATLNVNAKGAKSLVKNGGTALAANDIKAGEIKFLVYDGTNLQIIGDGGGGATITASNGLTKTGDNITLGGTLTQNTSFTGSTRNINWDINEFNITAAQGMLLDLILGDYTLFADNGTISFTSSVGGNAVTISPDGNITLTPGGSGNVVVPTKAPGTNSTAAASTAFVTTADNLKADLASPALTGTPTAPTAAQGTNTTQIATTAFVNSEIAADAVPLARTVAGIALSSNITATALNDALETRRILYKNNVSSSVTGTTSESILDSYLIPAGTIQVNDIINVVSVVSKSGTVSGGTVRYKVNTTASLPGTSIGMSNGGGGATVLWFKTARELVFKNSLTSQIAFSTSTTSANDVTTSTGAVTSLSLDFSVDQHIMVTSQVGSVGETMTLESWYIEIIRGN